MKHKVFVYGTLRRGQGNHMLLEGSKFEGEHRTAPEFTMVRVGSGWYPAIVCGGSTLILGEVYAVTQQVMELEGYPRHYDRKQIETPYGRAWVYFYDSRIPAGPVIPSGDWAEAEAS